MPLPERKEGEPRETFISRCMGDSVMNNEYPDQSQRSAVCMSKAMEDLNTIEAMDFQLAFSPTLRLKPQMADEDAGYPPNCNEGYVEKNGKCVPIDKSSNE